MQNITKALERILRQHEPFPAIVMDRYWNVLLTNDSAPRFFNCFIDMAARKGSRNVLYLIFDPKGMRPFIANWKDVAASLFQRVYRESVGRVVDEKTKELLATLQAYPDVKTKLEEPHSLSAMPFIPISFVNEGKVLNFLSMITTVGAPLSITAQELRLECMFPAGEESEKSHP
jgi:MmyB-like transcription regulator ligand binding domain